MPLFGPPNIEKMKENRNVKGLIKALKDKEINIRSKAAEALGNIGDEQAVDPLISALFGQYSSVSRSAAKALGQIGGAHAIERLVTTAVENKYSRKAAIHALTELGDEAIEKLMTVLSGQDGDTCLAVTREIDKSDWRPGTDEIAIRYWLFAGEEHRCSSLGAPAVEPLIDHLLNHDNGIVRVRAAHALGEIGDERAVEPLITVLEGRGEGVYRTAVVALGKIGDERAVEPLITVLEDSDKDIRQVAVIALGEIEDKRAVEPLIAVLKDADGYVRRAAAEALFSMGWKPAKEEAAAWYSVAIGNYSDCIEIGSPAVEALVSVLKDPKSTVRMGAARALGDIGDVQAVEPLLVALKDMNSDVRAAVAEALDKLGWKPAAEEAASWYWIAAQNWDECIAIGSPAVEPLLTLFKDSNISIGVIETLGKIGDKRAVEPLLETLNNRDVKVQRAAANALDDIGDARAIAPLSAMFNENPEKIGLYGFGDAALPTYIAALRSTNEGVRSSAARHLGIVGSKQAVDPLIAVLDEYGEDVPHNAAVSLAQIGDEHGVQAVIDLIKHYKYRKEFPYFCGTLTTVVAREAFLETNILLDMLNDNNDNILYMAVRALGNTGDLRAVEPLISALEVYNASGGLVYLNLISALGDLGDKRAVKPLQELLEAESDANSRDYIQTALDRIEAADNIDKQGDLLSDKDEENRQRAALALGNFGNARAVEPLIAALEDKSYSVRRNTAIALGKLGDEQAVKPLIVVLQNRLEDNFVHQAAAWALGEVGDTQAVEALLTAVGSRFERVRKAAIEALRKMDDPRAREAIKAAQEERLASQFVMNRASYSNVDDCLTLVSGHALEKAGSLSRADVESAHRDLAVKWSGEFHEGSRDEITSQLRTWLNEDASHGAKEFMVILANRGVQVAALMGGSANAYMIWQAGEVYFVFSSAK